MSSSSSRSPAALLEQWHEKGYFKVEAAISIDSCNEFISQIEEELRAGSVGTQDRTSKENIQLRAPETWPRGKKRRVVECAPQGVGSHWEELRTSSRLGAALDELLGAGKWEINLNDFGLSPVRHWYFPITFPEHEYTVRRGPSMMTFSRQPDRKILLRSWRDEIQADGPFTDPLIDAPWRWSPVSRRRFRGKGWHIDVGPGFPNDGIRTSEGHPFQAAILLLLLSDCSEGEGGTAIIPGSHHWVSNKLAECGDAGIPHSELNQWCVEKVLEQEKSGALRLPPRSRAAAEDFVHVEQVVGKRGDIVCMHPLAIHSGTTNLSADRPRLMGNGMVRRLSK